MSELAEADVSRIAREVLVETLPAGSVQRVTSAEGVDEDGASALRVLAVVSPAALEYDQLDAQIDAKVLLQRRLAAAGEQRFAYLRVVSEQELGNPDG